MELFTATEQTEKVLFWQLEVLHVCTRSDKAHIDTIFKFLPHARQRGKKVKHSRYRPDLA
jgi:hypothetical protein